MFFLIRLRYNGCHGEMSHDDDDDDDDERSITHVYVYIYTHLQYMYCCTATPCLYGNSGQQLASTFEPGKEAISLWGFRSCDVVTTVGQI